MGNLKVSSDARSVSASDLANSVNYASSASYVPSGALNQYTLGASINASMTYNSRLQPAQMFYGTNTPGTFTGITCPATVGNIMHRTYAFGAGTNDNGNVQSIANCRDTKRTQNFDYDALNRIADAYTSGTTGSAWGQAFTIDAWGNLTAKAAFHGNPNPETFSVTADVNNRLVGYRYDTAGNMTGNSPTTYAYDAENRMSSTTTSGATWTYVYDGDGERVIKSSSATNGTLYWAGSGSDALAESNLSGVFQSEYIFFNGKRVARRDGAGGAVRCITTWRTIWGRPV